MAIGRLLALILLAAPVVQAATPLPDACGKDVINFDVKTDKGPLPTADAEGGPSRIVFIKTLQKDFNVLMHPTVRFGLDGAWVEAVKGSSYFTVPGEPGEHHLRVAWQSHF